MNDWIFIYFVVVFAFKFINLLFYLKIKWKNNECSITTFLFSGLAHIGKSLNMEVVCDLSTNELHILFTFTYSCVWTARQYLYTDIHIHALSVHYLKLKSASA